MATISLFLHKQKIKHYFVVFVNQHKRLKYNLSQLDYMYSLRKDYSGDFDWSQ